MPPGTRPSGGRLREALFSIWAGRIPGARVLDLYAGSGSVGLEALSRGAAAVTLVERSRPTLSVLRRNLELAGGAVRLVAVEASTALTRLAREGARFDLLFVDPPYDLEIRESELEALGAVAAEEASLAIERRSGSSVPTEGSGWIRVSTRRYGDSELILLARG